MPLGVPTRADRAWYTNIFKPFIDLLEQKVVDLESAVDPVALQARLANMIVYAPTSTRPAGDQYTLFTGAADPGTSAKPGELWIGDAAP